MPVVYTLNADEVPGVRLPDTVLDPNADPPAPTVFRGVTDGEVLDEADIDADCVRSELIARHGGGGWAVGAGCDLEAVSGLTVRRTVGLVMIDGPLLFAAVDTLALANGTRSFLWVLQTGDLSARTDTDPPVEPAAFLGSVLTSGGAITQIDYSGRVELRSGHLWRKTADPGQPGDTPDPDVSFYHRSAGGYYYWDGESYAAAFDAYTVMAEDPDINPGTLIAKLLAGVGISLAVVTDGGIKKVEVTADADANFHAEELEQIVTSIPLGEDRKVRIDFSPRGRFADGYFWRRVEIDQNPFGTSVIPCDAFQQGLDDPRSVMYFVIENALDAGSDLGADYYGSGAHVRWTPSVKGLDWTAGPGDAPIVEVRPYAFAGAGAGGGSPSVPHEGHIDDASDTPGTPTADLVLTAPGGGVAQDQRIIIAVAVETDTNADPDISAVDDQGNTYTLDVFRRGGSGGTQSVAILSANADTALAAADEITVSFAGPVTEIVTCRASADAWSGVVTAAAQDVTGDGEGNSNTPTTGLMDETAQDVELFVAAIYIYDPSAGGYAPGTGWTGLTDVDDRLFPQYREVPVVGQYTAYGTLPFGFPEDWLIAAASYKAA